MGDGPARERKPRRKRKSLVMSPEAEARFARRISVLLGLIPLSKLSQDETDWVFAQKVRLAWDQQGR